MEVSKQIVMKKISEVRPYIRNPRKNDKTVELLVEIIPVVGFNVPLVIDKKGVIVKGHARYNAAIRLGMDEIPCIITDADEEAIKLDRLADNKISEFSDWIDEGLMHELDTLNIDFDLSGLGFSMPDTSSFDEFFQPQESVAASALQESEEERRARFQAYLESSEAAAIPKTQITSQEAIDKAKEKAASVPTPPAKYHKVVCEHCGHVMFVREGDAVFLQ